MQRISPWQVRGATKAVAKELGISEAAVSQWRKAGVPEKHRATVDRVIAGILAAPPPRSPSAPHEAAGRCAPVVG